MKRTFKAFGLAGLIGCCALSGSPLSVDDDAIPAVISDPPTAENVPHVNAFQHPFLLKPIHPESAGDDNMVRSPSREERTFQHPFLVKPNDAPAENDAVFVDGGSASGMPGMSGKDIASYD